MLLSGDIKLTPGPGTNEQVNPDMTKGNELKGQTETTQRLLNTPYTSNNYLNRQK